MDSATTNFITAENAQNAPLDERPWEERWPGTALALQRANQRIQERTAEKHAAEKQAREAERLRQERLLARSLARTPEGRIELARMGAARIKEREAALRAQNETTGKASSGSDAKEKNRMKRAVRREQALFEALRKKTEQASQGRGSKG